MSDNTTPPLLPSQPFSLPGLPAQPAQPANVGRPEIKSLEELAVDTRAAFDEDKKSEEAVQREAAAAENRLMKGHLSSDDLIYKPWSTYSKYMDDMIELKEWVVKTLGDQDRTAEVAIARKERGKRYNEMYGVINQLLSRQIVASGKKWGGADRNIIVDMIANDILGLGPLEPLWRDDEITDIIVNGPNKVKVQIRGKLVPVPGARFRDSTHLLNVCQQILAPMNRVIDVAHPIQDGSLSDGSRVNIVHNDIASDGPLLTIRRFPDVAYTLEELVQKGSLNSQMAEDLGNYIHLGMNLIVVGATGAGKTSALNALSGCIPSDESIVVIEDTKELKLNENRDVRSMQARPALQAGQESITIRKLVKNSLRMTPDRIIVGEVRDFTAYDMLQAMNTGHDGSMTTVHANDAEAGIERIVNLLSEGGGGDDSAVDSTRALSLIASSVDILVTLYRFEDGSRRFSGIYEVPTRVDIKDGNKSTLYPVPLWEFEREGYDDKNNVIGSWVKKNDLSEAMARKHSIAHRTRLTLDEIYKMSAV